jgi:uncharacterized membrane protein YidH (DUF202 family)
MKSIMDFKKFGLVIIFLGILILGYGAIQFGANQPKKFDKSESKTGIFGGRDDLGNWLETQTINLERKHKSKQATKIMLAGGVVLIIGGGIRFSAKK